MNCNEAVAALVASLEHGTPMTDEQREHIRSCERCRELLDSAKQFQSLLAGNGVEAPPMDPTLLVAEEEVRRRRLIRVVKVTAGVILVLAAAATAVMLPIGNTTFLQRLAIVAAGIFMATFIAVPIVLLLTIARGTNSGTKRRLYKRLKPGRQLSGVCLGIAEAFGLEVRLVRLVFIVLFFFKGVGFWIYILLDLVMPVHPDDRRYLLRFRLRRWFQKRMAHANSDAR